MAREQHDKLEAIKYFKELSNISKRFVNVCYSKKKRILSEYDYMVGESPFSQVEINRLISNK